MTDLIPAKRIPLAANDDPSDEELSLVMLEAKDLAMARTRESDEWIRRKLAEAVADARNRDVVAAP